MLNSNVCRSPLIHQVCAIHYIELLNSRLNTFTMPAMSKLHYWPVLKPDSLLPFNSGPKYPERDHNRWGIWSGQTKLPANCAGILVHPKPISRGPKSQ